MKITRNGQEFELSASEITAVYREKRMQYLIEDAQFRAEGYLDESYLNFLNEADYEKLATMFNDSHDCSISDNEQWDSLLEAYKREIEKNTLCTKEYKTSWGSIHLCEDRIEILDEDGELFDYVSLEGKDLKCRMDKFEELTMVLARGDYSFSLYLYTNFPSAILLGESSLYETTKTMYGEEFVNKFGGYFIVVKE